MISNIAAATIILLLILPIGVYLSVKLGTFGYLKAKFNFEKEHNHKENANGDS